MPQYKYLIVGGGMTAAAAVAGIREVDADGTIGMISMEEDPPYKRPPLSKALWKGAQLDSIWRDVKPFQAGLHLNQEVLRIDLQKKEVADNAGETYVYEKLLLATGGQPRRLPFGGDRIIYFRTLPDYRKLRKLADEREHFAVIGGGFIGSEIAAALTMNGKHVSVVFPEIGIGGRVFPEDLSRSLNAYFEEKGTEVLAGASVGGVEAQGDKSAIKLENGRDLVVDGIVAGIGIQPNVELAKQAGLTVENGICVDEQLRTSNPDVYAAGDVASSYSPALSMRRRVEHEDNANTMGRMAGRNMAGHQDVYHYLPFFYSDLFDLGYEAVGELDNRLEMVSDWKEPYREGVVYYLQDGRVRGVLLWNVWKQVDAARRLIGEPGPFSAAELTGRLPASS